VRRGLLLNDDKLNDTIMVSYRHSRGEYAVKSRIGLWGGSCALRLPKASVEKLGLKAGEPVSVDVEDGALVIRPAKAAYALDQLVDQARTLVPPVALDDAPKGDEAL